MALSVYPGWETQLFVPCEQRAVLERASLLITHLGHGFHPDDRLAQVIDAGLSGLRSGTDLLPESERQMMLYGKFDNPMLGLIGAHLMLLESAPDWALLDHVVQNLEHLLPGAADVHALRLATALRRGEAPVGTPVTAPPMLRRGLDAVLEASTILPEIVPEGGIIERLAPYVLAGRIFDTPSKS